MMVGRVVQGKQSMDKIDISLLHVIHRCLLITCMHSLPQIIWGKNPPCCKKHPGMDDRNQEEP